MFQRLALGLLALVAVALLVLNGLAWTGGLIEEEASPPPPAAPSPQPEPQPEPVSSPPASPTPPPPAAVSLTITATRGDCWVEVHATSQSGRVLFAGTLASGRTLKFNRPKLWLRLGAASNVDITVNGRPSTIPPGTVELLLPT